MLIDPFIIEIPYKYVYWYYNKDSSGCAPMSYNWVYWCQKTSGDINDYNTDIFIYYICG